MWGEALCDCKCSVSFFLRWVFLSQVLEIHLRTMHADKNGQMIVCKMCNVVFGTLVELETHTCATLGGDASAANAQTTPSASAPRSPSNARSNSASATDAAGSLTAAAASAARLVLF